MKALRICALWFALAAAGCGDTVLWSRWQAEAALHKARAAERRALAAGSAASPAQLDRAERLLAGVASRFPASEWAPRAGRAGRARDVLAASGAAALEVGIVRQGRGRDAAAAEAFAVVEREYALLPALVVRARTERIRSLERLGRFDDALEALGALAAMNPMGDPEAREPSPPVLAAPLELAARLRAGGHEARASAVLADADARLARDMEAASGPNRAALAEGLSRVRAARGEAGGSLAALRVAMRADPRGRDALFARLLAARALEAGAPESVFAYSRWAASQSGSRTVTAHAWFIAAQAWERLARPDSALANYDAILTMASDPGPVGVEARFRQSQLLERMGQWERARAGFIALAARFPSHPHAFAALRHVVEHHLRAGEPEVARVVGGSALQNLARLLQTNQDARVQRDARAVRADLLVALGRREEAEAELLDLWRRFPEDSLAEDAGLRAARLAEQRPAGAARADSIRSALRARATNAAVRRAAAAPGF